MRNLQFLLDSHEFSVGDSEDNEDCEEESKFSADEFVKRSLNHALSLRLLLTLQRHAALGLVGGGNLLLLRPGHQLSVYERQDYVG